MCLIWWAFCFSFGRPHRWRPTASDMLALAVAGTNKLCIFFSLTFTFVSKTFSHFAFNVLLLFIESFAQYSLQQHGYPTLSSMTLADCLAGSSRLLISFFLNIHLLRPLNWKFYFPCTFNHKNEFCFASHLDTTEIQRLDTVPLKCFHSNCCLFSTLLFSSALAGSALAETIFQFLFLFWFRSIFYSQTFFACKNLYQSLELCSERELLS